MTALNLYLVNNPPADPCGICMEELDNGKSVVAHEVGDDGSDGALHPLHLGCMKTIFTYADKCPACQNKINVESAVTLKEKSIKPYQIFASNAIIGTIVGFSLSEFSQRAIEMGFASVPVIATVAQDMFSSEAVTIGLSVVGAIGVGALLTGGVVVGSFALARAVNDIFESSEIPSEVHNQGSQLFGLLSGTIVSLVSSSSAGAVAGGIVAGSIAVFKPDILY